jgi:hypothetical protein
MAEIWLAKWRNSYAINERTLCKEYEQVPLHSLDIFRFILLLKYANKSNNQWEMTK